MEQVLSNDANANLPQLENELQSISDGINNIKGSTRKQYYICPLFDWEE